MSTIKTRLETITTANGYSRDVRFVERTMAPLPDTISTPAIYVYEGDETKDTNSFGKLAGTLRVMVVYLEEDYTDPRTTANQMLADVTKAVGTDITLTGANSIQTLANLYERGNEVVIDPNNANLIVAGVDFDAIYEHELGNQDNA